VVAAGLVREQTATGDLRQELAAPPGSSTETRRAEILSRLFAADR
jgi:hypothetical protein